MILDVLIHYIFILWFLLDGLHSEVVLDVPELREGIPGKITCSVYNVKHPAKIEISLDNKSLSEIEQKNIYDAASGTYTSVKYMTDFDRSWNNKTFKCMSYTLGPTGQYLPHGFKNQTVIYKYPPSSMRMISLVTPINLTSWYPLTILCAVKDNNADCNIVWTSDLLGLNLSNTIHVGHHDIASALSVNVSQGSSGHSIICHIDCVEFVVNLSKVFAIDLPRPPTIEIRPTYQRSFNGDILDALECVVDSNPIGNISWIGTQTNDTKIKCETSRVCLLQLNKTTVDSATNYVCLSVNIHGQDYKRPNASNGLHSELVLDVPELREGIPGKITCSVNKLKHPAKIELSLDNKSLPEIEQINMYDGASGTYTSVKYMTDFDRSWNNKTFKCMSYTMGPTGQYLSHDFKKQTVIYKYPPSSIRMIRPDTPINMMPWYPFTIECEAKDNNADCNITWISDILGLNLSNATYEGHIDIVSALNVNVSQGSSGHSISCHLECVEVVLNLSKVFTIDLPHDDTTPKYSEGKLVLINALIASVVSLVVCFGLLLGCSVYKRLTHSEEVICPKAMRSDVATECRPSTSENVSVQREINEPRYENILTSIEDASDTQVDREGQFIYTDIDIEFLEQTKPPAPRLTTPTIPCTPVCPSREGPIVAPE